MTMQLDALDRLAASEGFASMRPMARWVGELDGHAAANWAFMQASPLFPPLFMTPETIRPKGAALRGWGRTAPYLLSASSTLTDALPSTVRPFLPWKSAIACLVLPPIAPSGGPTS